jgi:hypothetical protein
MSEFHFVGISAPVFIWIASAGIIAFALWQIVLLLFLAGFGRFRFLSKATRSLEELQKRCQPRLHRGIDGADFDAARRIVRAEPQLTDAWERFQTECLEMPDDDGGSSVSYFRTRPSSEAFSEGAIVDKHFNRAWFLALPGILTGIGLLVTFIAILLALRGLRVGSGETVEGIKPLIAGLSGKFLSSIVALSCATLYSFVQSPVLNRISRKRLELCLVLDELVPRRDTASLVRDIAEGIGEQTKAFKSFGTQLSVVVKSAFSQSMAESIGPQQERMIQALERLNALMQSAEASKQESMTGELAGLLRSLESSLTRTMNGMGERFTEALTGSASSQMEQVIKSLGATAELVQQMNAHSTQTQAALTSLIENSKQSSLEQMALGKRQVEELSETLRNLMVQLNSSAGTSVNQMSATLTAVVHDLSTKVSTLGVEVSNAMRRSSEDATGAAREVIVSAASWSAKSEAHLETLLERLTEDSSRAEAMRSLLDKSLGGFQQAIAAQGAALSDMRTVASQMSAATTAMAGTLAKIEARETALVTIAQKSGDQVAALERMTSQHRDSLQRMNGILEQYTKVFAEAERTTGDLLKKVGSEIQQLSTITQAHFEKLVANTDNHLGDAVAKLGGSVSELGETLDSLEEILARARGGGSQPTRPS